MVIKMSSVVVKGQSGILQNKYIEEKEFNKTIEEISKKQCDSEASIFDANKRIDKIEYQKIKDLNNEIDNLKKQIKELINIIGILGLLILCIFGVYIVNLL